MSTRHRGRAAKPYRRPRRDPARSLAFEALRAVDERDAYANLVLPPLLREARERGRLDGRDAALATELVYGTLRWQGTYDAIVAECVDRPLREVDPPVLDVLTLGAHQLLGTRIPVHAGVSATVELARAVLGDGRAKFVNAVLRKIAADDLSGWLERIAPPYEEDPEEHLGLRHAHPRWVVSALWDALGGGRSDIEALLAADNERPEVTLVARPGRTTARDLLAQAAEREEPEESEGSEGSEEGRPEAARPATRGGQESPDALDAESAGAGAVRSARPGRWSPYAVRLAEGGDPGLLPAVRDGDAGVQDEGSQLVALAFANAPLADEPGGSGAGGDERWLDGCAGPGGKAALLAGLAAERGAVLLAAERQPHRAGLVARALSGNPGPCAVVTADATRPAWRPDTFDRVLVDVPCTGLGALRRRPEARWRRHPDDLDGLARPQRQLLGQALRSVRPGGVVGYATCSPHPAETRAVVDDVLRRGGAELIDARPLMPGVPELGAGPDVQLWPHLHGTDAMYLALLRRTA